MMKDTDLTYLKNKYTAYWNRENKDRPLLALYAPDASYQNPVVDIQPAMSIEQRWIDPEHAVRSFRSGLARTRYLGEAFPFFGSNLGPDILGAILGCDLKFAETTSWAVHCTTNLENHPDHMFDDQNIWWRRLLELTQEAATDAKGDYLVAISDLHAGLDALVSLFSPQQVCLGLVDTPQIIEKRIWQIFDVFRTVYDRLYEVVKSNQDGATCNWMGVFHPGRWYVTSCDLICMLSRDDFRRFVLPELEAELDMLDASLFHLDGPGALRHLDDLLSLPKLNGIQWVPGVGAGAARDWIDVLKKIQNAGKLIQMTITPDDYLPMLEALEPEGVMYNCACHSVQEAEEMLSYVKK